jgi:ABC-type polysaccharide/polyol phosphate transport system ATPase subunit
VSDLPSKAIEVRSVTKSFFIPHERRTTLKEYVLHPLKRTSYERNDALKNISFSIDRGEFFGVVGPNGSGKSTLLKTLAGIYRADEGLIEVRGTLSPFIELGVGFSMDLNARDNIRINGTLLGFSASELEAKTSAIMEFSGLERFIDQRLKNYSSGMLLRLAYSIAIQVPFDILLLDEVLAVGDAEFQAKCFATFERFREEGKTVVLVSHDLLSVEKFCQRTLLLENGEIKALGPSEEVVAQYRRGSAPLRATASVAGNGAAPTERKIEWISRAEALSGEIVRARLEPARSVVDVGPGINPQTLLSADVHVCIEPFEPYVARLRANVGEDPRFVFLTGTWAEILPAFADHSIDTILALDVIEHLERADGQQFLVESTRVARRQIVLFTPLGFYPQSYDPGDRDRWGMGGGLWQTHRSGWTPEDFPNTWHIVACADFHFVDEHDQPLPEPFGAFWAIYTAPRLTEAEAVESTDMVRE